MTNSPSRAMTSPAIGIWHVARPQPEPVVTAPRQPAHEDQALHPRSLYAAISGGPVRPPTGMFHACAKYDDRHEAGTNHYPRQAHRRQPCATAPNFIGTTQPGVAPCVRESLVLFGIIPGELPSVQGRASKASRRVGRVTANGYERHMTISRSSGLPSRRDCKANHLCKPLLSSCVWGT